MQARKRKCLTRCSSNHLPEAKGTCLNSVEPFLTWTAHRAIGITNKTLGGSQKSGESRFYGKRNLFHKKTSLAEKSERVSQSDKLCRTGRLSRQPFGRRSIGRVR